MNEPCKHKKRLWHVVVENHTDFENHWAGWKMRGEFLISPEGLRLRTPQLRGLFRVHGQQKRAKKIRQANWEQLELFEK